MPTELIEQNHQTATKLPSKHGKMSRRKRRRLQRDAIIKQANNLEQPKREDQDNQQDTRGDQRVVVRDNVNFVKFYKQQPFFLDGEFDIFMKSMQEPLPASFRINNFDQTQANFLRELVRGPRFREINVESLEKQSKSKEDEAILKKSKLSALEPLKWYPDDLAWQMNLTRVDLRKSPKLQELHKFIMAETDNGLISRQETVSMIPPLVLDVHRGHTVLDMCAAPGSKTAQLLEYLLFKRNQVVVESDDLFDAGMVVANDVDNKRCYMLVHQSSRLNSPNCVIINEDASRLPSLRMLVDEAKQPPEFENIKFDRILCDVPCSGDGTARKNVDVWRKWNIGNSNNFHKIQLKILRRGLELLKKDGLLVYSTCSLNPAEDESVIAQALRESMGSVVLDDIDHKLPGLKYRPGCSKWVVVNRDMTVIDDHDKIPNDSANHIHSSLFQPTEDEQKEFNLHRCIRVLPHLQNTGGFFIAGLRKIHDKLPWEQNGVDTKTKDEDEERVEESAKTATSADYIDDGTQQPLDTSAVKKTHPNSNNKGDKQKFKGFKEDPFFFIDETDVDWQAIKTSYGLIDSFPVSQLLHRCTKGSKRTLYLVSKQTRNFIRSNQELQATSQDKHFVKIINGGMKLFTRASSQARFRICQDGVNEILPFISSKLKVAISRQDLIELIKARNVSFDQLSSAEYIKSSIEPGSFVLMYKLNEGSPEMPLVGWKGEYTVALYVSDTYRVHLCALLGIEVPELKRHHQKQATDEAPSPIADDGDK